MNKPLIPSNINDRTEPGANKPLVDSDPYANESVVNATIISETQTGGNFVAVDPLGETIIYETPLMSEAIPQTTPIDATVESLTVLLNREESEHFRTHWNEIQGRFVDEPRSAVQQADALVSEVIEKITQMFANEHSLLEGQWEQGKDVSTEDLRMTLQRYRSFFNRLVV